MVKKSGKLMIQCRPQHGGRKGKARAEWRSERGCFSHDLRGCSYSVKRNPGMWRSKLVYSLSTHI